MMNGMICHILSDFPVFQHNILHKMQVSVESGDFFFATFFLIFA